MTRKTWFLWCILGCMAPAVFGQFVNDDLLPPAPAWDGKSRALVAPADDPWITPSERSGLVDSPRYEETVTWLDKLVAAAPQLHMTTIGRSWEGRDIVMVVASKERRFAPAELAASGKPLFLAHAGIHSGEIDGKDAGMMLLRDMTVRGVKTTLLDDANFLFIPILGVDGHERVSPYNRINQRGPRSMGWRTNGRNLNLNRDFAKIETPEVQALISVLNRYQPDLYFDLHVTDGIDYQYDITFGYNGTWGYSPAGAAWLAEVMTPALNRDLAAMGHIPGPLIFATNNTDLSKGIVDWTAGPRFSNVYGDVRHVPTVLVENHSLKPYDQRVLGTYVLLESALRVLAKSGKALREATAQDRKRRPEQVTLTFKPEETPPETLSFLAIQHKKTDSDISGGTWVQWTGQPETVDIPYIKIHQPHLSARRPKAYWIPANWPEIIKKLRIHGASMEQLDAPREVTVEMYRLEEAKLAEAPFEGRVQVTAKTFVEKRKELFPKGSVRVSTDQPLCELIVLLLEPDSPDSFFQWGYFHEVMQRTEYFENYALEPLARKMLAEDPSLKATFEAKLAADEDFAKNPRARLDWFYRRSPYVDARHMLYPIAREP